MDKLIMNADVQEKLTACIYYTTTAKKTSGVEK